MIWEPKIMRSYNDRGDPLSITIQYEQGGAIEQIWPKRNKPWVGLTNEERLEAEQDCYFMDEFDTAVYAMNIEAKLKEKNGG